MKKADWLSYGIAVLLTVAFLGIFFMGTDGIAQINNVACQDYECAVTTTQCGEIVNTDTYPVELCYDGCDVYLYGMDFTCHLYPADSNNSKRLLGIASYNEGSSAGCSVELGGKITVKLAYVQNGNGYVGTQNGNGDVDTLKCKRCYGCFKK